MNRTQISLKLLLLVLLTVTAASQFINPGCASFTNNLCNSCLDRYYLLNNICLPVNPLCLTYNQTNGNCLSCYSGS